MMNANMHALIQSVSTIISISTWYLQRIQLCHIISQEETQNCHPWRISGSRYWWNSHWHWCPICCRISVNSWGQNSRSWWVLWCRFQPCGDKQEGEEALQVQSVLESVNKSLCFTCSQNPDRKHCVLVNEPTTLCCHAEANFSVCYCIPPFSWMLIYYISQGKYQTWVKKVRFNSMLPSNVKAWKEKAQHTQQTINSHLTECKLAKRVLPYSDKLFRKAAIEWLAATDQVSLHYLLVGIVTEARFVKLIQAFEHPRFKAMIDVAVYAINSVKIPRRKATYVEIMCIFKKTLFFLINFICLLNWDSISDLEQCH